MDIETELQLSTMKGLALLAQYLTPCTCIPRCSTANHEVGSDPTPATAGLSILVHMRSLLVDTDQSAYTYTNIYICVYMYTCLYYVCHSV